MHLHLHFHLHSTGGRSSPLRASSGRPYTSACTVPRSMDGPGGDSPFDSLRSLRAPSRPYTPHAVMAPLDDRYLNGTSSNRNLMLPCSSRRNQLTLRLLGLPVVPR